MQILTDRANSSILNTLDRIVFGFDRTFKQFFIQGKPTSPSLFAPFSFVCASSSKRAILNRCNGLLLSYVANSVDGVTLEVDKLDRRNTLHCPHTLETKAINMEYYIGGVTYEGVDYNISVIFLDFGTTSSVTIDVTVEDNGEGFLTISGDSLT